ncbi:hypothetical protein Taqua_01423 [Tepidimonas aquatica]|uniref:Uncharacterized protein n=1 Tax=Tepidimonas aquatica TaxID=247482 RepID=A0A554WMB6_9BURK|nr:hypothetical protein Taqua_01423 [Tepidimonas aquatica]
MRREGRPAEPKRFWRFLKNTQASVCTWYGNDRLELVLWGHKGQAPSAVVQARPGKGGVVTNPSSERHLGAE